MDATSEQCGNCGQAIGKLETPRVWQDHVVCAACHAKLNAGTTTATPPPVTPMPPAPPALDPQQPTLPGVRTIEQTGKQWKLQMLLAALLVAAGVVTMCAGCRLAFNGAGQQGRSSAGTAAGIGFIMIAAGLLWGIAARLLAWWYHG
jgi:hypothetical protein